MRTLGLLLCFSMVLASACKEAQKAPDPYADGGPPVIVLPDAGPAGDAVGTACPCTGTLVPVHTSSGCVCRRPCQPQDDVPRCARYAWEVCAQLSEPGDDGNPVKIDAGVCLPAQPPGAECSPEPCGEILVCARVAGDTMETCRFECNWDVGDAGTADAASADAAPEDAAPEDAAPEDATARDGAARDAADAGSPDAAGLDIIPPEGGCPPYQACHRMENDGGVCFPP